jgi:hypothetical protein
VKNDKDLKDIPVVALANSNSEQDVIRTYEAHAAASIEEPVDFARLIDCPELIADRRLTLVQLPRQK